MVYSLVKLVFQFHKISFIFAGLLRNEVAQAVYDMIHGCIAYFSITIEDSPNPFSCFGVSGKGKYIFQFFAKGFIHTAVKLCILVKVVLLWFVDFFKIIFTYFFLHVFILFKILRFYN